MNIELLESRNAPATLVNPTTLTYADIDGDLVTVKTSAGAFVFTNPPSGTAFTDTFFFTPPNAIGGQVLQFIDLRQGSGYQGVDLTVSVVKAGSGDGLAAIGLILAPGIDLGIVSVKGDLGEIDCGDSDTTTPGLEMLSVRSMGRYGDVTDALIPGLTSDIKGALGALRVTTDIKDASIDVTANVDADARVGRVSIGGSIIGGAAAGSGRIITQGDVGPVTIGRDLIGGDGQSSGGIFAGGALRAVSISGSVVGGSGAGSGRIVSGGGLTSLKIGGNLIGGTGLTSGAIIGGAKVAAVTIGGSQLGGLGESSGSLFITGDLGPVKIAHDVKGGAGDESGKIDAGGNLTSLTIRGSLLGGGGDYNTINSGGFIHRAQIFAIGGIGPVTIGHDVAGGAGAASGGIRTPGDLAGLNIGGSILGGTAPDSAGILVTGAIGAVKIGHDVVGAAGANSASVTTSKTISSVTIGGSLIGGASNGTGAIFSTRAMGPIKIGHDVLGGSGPGSGAITTASVNGVMAGVTIGGSLIGGSGNQSGMISSDGRIVSVRIGHDLVGGSLGSAATAHLLQSGTIESNHQIASVFIGGSIISGTDVSSSFNLFSNASIRAQDDLGSLTVRGGLIGNVGANGNGLVHIVALGQATPGTTSDVAIGRISIGGRVEFAKVLAGYDRDLITLNADAQIGTVRVGGDWIASSIVAGAQNFGADGDPGGGNDNINFGDSNDAKIDQAGEPDAILSKIGSITIAGQVFGTPKSFSNTDAFGFVAEQIGALKVGTHAFVLQPGAGNDGLMISSGPGVALHEIDSLIGSTVQFLNPAKLVNTSTVTYDDIDGDHVTVKFSKPLLTAGNVNDVFKFESEIVGGPNSRQVLQLIDLRSLAAAGLGITVTVVPGGGDRLANIGAIISDDDLGTVTIPGDLGQIAAGDVVGTTKGLAALNVRTFGRFGLDTQPGMSATFILFVGGDIIGSLGSLTVKQDIAGASLAITGALGAMTIGGSLIGGSAPASGAISTALGIGPVKIGHHVQVGAAAGSGFIDTGTSIASVSVGGSLIGGVINADGTTLGPVRIGHNVIGGGADFSGRLSGNAGMSTVTIAGSLLGGPGNSSGKLFASAGGIGAVRIGHNIYGGTGDESGKIDSPGKLTSLSIRGSLVGGSGDQDTGAHSGQIFALADIGPVTIGHNVIGGAGGYAGGIQGGGVLTSVAVGGSLIGGPGTAYRGYLLAEELGTVKIGRDLSAGYVEGFNSIGSVTIGGSLVGGDSGYDGVIYNSAGRVGPVNVGHDVLGGAQGNTGVIICDIGIVSVTIGGSLVGGSSGEAGSIIGGEFGPIKIGRDLIGGSISGTQATLDSTGYIQGNRLASVTVGGSIIVGSDDSTGGSLTKNASIRSGNDIGAINVNGSLIGNVGDGTAANLSRVIITASGQQTLAANATLDLAIKSIRIGGRVEHAQILAGYSPTLGVDGPGSIGTMTVGGDWIASNLVAGADEDDDPSAPNLFGDFDDIPITTPGTAIVARIAAINLKGVVVGTATPANDHFGFVSHVIGSFKSAGFTAPLTNNKLPGALHDLIELSPLTGDITVREV